MSKIKVGIIRCDLHAYYYGALAFRHDPITMRDSEDGPGHASYFYFYLNYSDGRKITVPTVRGFELARVWDANRRQAEIMAEVFDDHPAVCDTFEEVSDGVDMVYIADCTGEGEDHLKLATPSLQKRVPTFVDKPFAYDVADAQAMVRLAKRRKTPVMSLSMLRVVPHATRFRNRFTELGEVEFGIVKGGGSRMDGHVHAISLAQHLFGPGVESVECMGKTPLGYVHLDYGGKPHRPPAGVVLNCRSGGSYHCAMYASAYSSQGAIHSPDIGDFVFPWGAAAILKVAKKMVQTGKPPVSYDEMIECIAVASAARLAQKRGKPVSLKEVMRRKS